MTLSSVFHQNCHWPDKYKVGQPLVDLILSMLRINPEERPSADKLLSHPIFKGRNIVPVQIVSSPPSQLSDGNQKRVTACLKSYTSNRIVLKLAGQIYRRTIGCNNLSDALKIQTCAWIAHKLVMRLPLDENKLRFPYQEILQTERTLCHHLGFKLHRSTKECLFIKRR